jgi:glycosyltransferase involved in cell wall biosynthesis
MYPLDRGLWGPTVRIIHLRNALARVVDLDVVEGFRPTRRLGLVRYALSGRLRGLHGIYVEAATTLPSETDLAFLALARLSGIPTITYIRDAYQLFPEYYAITSARRWLAGHAFLPAMRALAALSGRVAVPSRGLARALFGADRSVVLLPPASPAVVSAELRPHADQLLFVGNAREAVQGANLLIEATGIARSRGARVRLAIVCRPGEEPAMPLPDFVQVIRAEGREIEALLPDTIASAIPRLRTPYNDLAIPVKLYEYLAYGRPLLVTDCVETANVVRQAGCGLIVHDTAADLAYGIVELCAMSPQDREAMGAAAHAAARSATWEMRAHRILETLKVPSGSEPSS